MSKRYLVVGGVAGGASAAARIRRLDEKADILIYDKGPNISFSNCCLPNFLSREIEKSDDLIIFDPVTFKTMFNLPSKVSHEVIEIKADEHKVLVKNLLTGEVFEDHYDYLILSPGARAIRPKSIVGVNNDNVFVIKNVADIRKLDNYLEGNNVKDVVVVGGGFIGVEAAECMKHSGKNVSLVEGTDQIMRPFDYDMVQMLHKELHDNGINLFLSEEVVEINDKEVKLKSGKTIKAEAVVMAVGVTPDVDMCVEAGIELGETGAIKVDQNYRTNLPDIYAVGDAIEVFHSILKKKVKLPLAGPAQRQARGAVDSIFGRTVQNKGVIGSSCIRIFGKNAASTGLNERDCIENGIDYRTVLVMPNDKVGLMPNASPLHFKLVFEYPTGKILGAQAIGKGDVTKRVDVIATMITLGGDLEDLKELELCYAPPFSTAKDVVNYAALAGLNLLNGEYEQVNLSDVRELVLSGAYIIDVREKEAYEASHIKGAVNIPMSEIRNRLSEIPTDKPVYVHCRTSWYSYYVIQALKGNGFRNIKNIQGSFLGLSYNEYYNDIVTGRDSILTGYNFK